MMTTKWLIVECLCRGKLQVVSVLEVSADRADRWAARIVLDGKGLVTVSIEDRARLHTLETRRAPCWHWVNDKIEVF